MELTAAILAGGLGTRLRAVVSDRPKVMAPVAGRPFLAHLLDQLSAAGFRKAVLCTGYLAPMIEEEFGERYRGIELAYSIETSPLGTGGALANAAPHLSGDMLLVLNGDSYCDCRLAEFVVRQAGSGCYAGIALTHVEDVSRFGAVLTDTSQRVESFVEKGGGSGPGWINAGIYLLPRSFICGIPTERAVSLEKEMFPELLRRGLYGYRCEGEFVDIGIPEELKRSQTLFQRRKKGTP